MGSILVNLKQIERLTESDPKVKKKRWQSRSKQVSEAEKKMRQDKDLLGELLKKRSRDYIELKTVPAIHDIQIHLWVKHIPSGFFFSSL